MNKFFLTVHILAAILCVGPVTVAASMFPPIARRMLTSETPQTDGLDVLHRITRVYAWASLAVPVFGFAVAGGMQVMDEAWLIVSIVLTLAAALVLALLVVPAQSAVLAAAGGTAEARSGVLSKAKLLSMTSGIFALLWVVVLVLMVVKPGHTRG
jgi:preprotein translocase subunit SecG